LGEVANAAAPFSNMKNGKLKLGALVVVVALLAVAALWQLQQAEIKRLAAENAGLRTQLNQIASLKDSNGQLAEKLKAAVETSQANHMELMRLRGQDLKLRQLEQENNQLKAQRQKQNAQMREALSAATPSPERPQATPVTIIPDLNTIDLGVLELADGIAARFDLGGGTICVVTPTASSDGNVTMQIKSEVPNANGTALELATSRIIARPGQQCSISVGDRVITLAVKLK
jgi:hypothetical protein